MARHLLVDMRGWKELVNFAVARKVRNTYSSDIVHQTFKILSDNGIVDLTTSRRRRNRTMMIIKKRSWSAIQSDESENPRNLLKRLRVNRDAFD